jgi:hypothetical protein
LQIIQSYQWFQANPVLKKRSTVYLRLKNKNELLEKEVERLWQMVNHLTQHEELKSITGN